MQEAQLAAAGLSGGKVGRGNTAEGLLVSKVSVLLACSGCSTPYTVTQSDRPSVDQWIFTPEVESVTHNRGTVHQPAAHPPASSTADFIVTQSELCLA